MKEKRIETKKIELKYYEYKIWARVIVGANGPGNEWKKGKKDNKRRRQNVIYVNNTLRRLCAVVVCTFTPTTFYFASTETSYITRTSIQIMFSFCVYTFLCPYFTDTWALLLFSSAWFFFLAYSLVWLLLVIFCNVISFVSILFELSIPAAHTQTTWACAWALINMFHVYIFITSRLVSTVRQVSIAKHKKTKEKKVTFNSCVDIIVIANATNDRVWKSLKQKYVYLFDSNQSISNARNKTVPICEYTYVKFLCFCYVCFIVFHLLLSLHSLVVHCSHSSQ